MFKETFSSITIGLALGFTILSVCFAFSQAVYSGIFREYASLGAILILAGTGINIIIISLFSDIPIAVSRPQDEPLPLLLILIQGITLHFSSGDAGILTIFMAIILVTLLTGIILYLVGYFELGNLIRFVPFPIIAGFLAAAGLLLIINGMKQVLPEDFTHWNFNQLTDYQSLLLWMPSLFYGFLLFFATLRSKNNLLFPGLIFFAVVLFYLLFLLSGEPVTWLKTSHLLLNIEPASFKAIMKMDFVIHWSYLFSNLGYMLIIACLSAMALLFILVSLDVILNMEINFNKELKIAGIANIFTAMAGGIIGYHGLANTILLTKAPQKTRWIGLFCGALCIAAIFFSNLTLAWFPRFILSGLIIFLGLSLFYSWTFNVWHQFDKFDAIITIIVILISTLMSFILGVISGFIISFIFFILTYSWINPIRYILPGYTLGSIHQRPPMPSLILKKKGKEIIYIKLQNYLFFGSVYSLVLELKKILYREKKHPIKFVIYDFERVVGIDSSVEIVFKKIVQYAEKFEFCIILTNIKTEDKIYKRLINMSVSECFLIIPNMEKAINHCELQLLARENFDVENHKNDKIRLEDYLGQKDFKEAINRYFKDIKLDKGEHLFHKDAFSNELFYLESGQLLIYIDLPNGLRKNLSVIGPGNFIGELAFYLHTPRTASIYAEEDCNLKSIDQKTLKLMYKENPELYEKINQAIIFILAVKLSDTTKKLRIVSL